VAWVLAVPSVTTGGLGRMRSWISHLGSTWAAQIAALETNRAGKTSFIILTQFMGLLDDCGPAFYSGIHG
jgi:hypothetical protein